MTGGYFQIVSHGSDVTPSGNMNLHVNGTATDITATDGTTDFRLVGVFHFGGVDIANLETEVFLVGMKLELVQPGAGTVDNINVTFTARMNGESWKDRGRAIRCDSALIQRRMTGA